MHSEVQGPSVPRGFTLHDLVSLLKLQSRYLLIKLYLLMIVIIINAEWDSAYPSVRNTCISVYVCSTNSDILWNQSNPRIVFLPFVWFLTSIMRISSGWELVIWEELEIQILKCFKLLRFHCN